MRYIAFAVVLSIAIGMSGCVPSLQPLYTDKDLIFEPELLGDWVEAKPDSKGNLTFSKSDDEAYKVISTDEKAMSSFSGHLVKPETNASWTYRAIPQRTVILWSSRFTGGFCFPRPDRRSNCVTSATTGWAEFSRMSPLL